MNDRQMAAFTFAAFPGIGKYVVVAYSEIDGRDVVGCGETRADAAINLMQNAYPDARLEITSAQVKEINQHG